VHTTEGLLGDLEVGVGSKDDVTNTAHESFTHIADEVLKVVEKVLKVDEAKFGLKVSELAQMATSTTLLGTEGRKDAEGAANNRKNSLEVKLRRLSEVGRRAEVVDLEEVGTTLAESLHKSWRSDLDELVVLIPATESVHHSVTDSKHGEALWRTEGDVTGVEAAGDITLSCHEGLDVDVALADKLPPVDVELVVDRPGLTLRRLVALGELAQSTGDLD